MKTSGIVALFLLYIFLAIALSSRSSILFVLAIAGPAIIALIRLPRRDARVWLLLSLMTVLASIAMTFLVYVSGLYT